MGFYTESGNIRPHLKFEKLPLEKGRKMPVYKIHNYVLGEDIGIIHWRGGWRQYVSQTYPKIDMSRSCNKEVNDFIDGVLDFSDISYIPNIGEKIITGYQGYKYQNKLLDRLGNEAPDLFRIKETFLVKDKIHSFNDNTHWIELRLE